MRRSRLLTMAIGLGLIVAACASPVSAPGEPSEEEPTAETAESEAPAASTAPAESQAGDGEGDGGAPALADGPWTGGQGQITVSGGVDWTADEPLATDVSETEDAKTLLAYNTADGQFVTIFINFIGVPFAASVTATDFNARSEDCEVTYNRADDTGIDATFSCVVDEFHMLSAGEPPTDPVTIEGSLTATH